MTTEAELIQLATAIFSVALRLAVIIVVAFLASRILDAILRTLIYRTLRINRDSSREEGVKAQTLHSFTSHTGQIIIGISAAFFSLREVGVDITPLLASAGIAGVALGLGAQSIIRDFVGGFLIILENQYTLGDVVKIGEHTGTVEHINLRRTMIRNVDGALITIPNGDVRVVLNLTREWSQLVLDVDVAFDDGPARAQAVMRQVAEELANDPDIGPAILEPPGAPGIESLGATSLRLRLTVKTKPAQQWAVGRELRARLQAAFKAQHIRLVIPDKP